jgi:LppP/LprE lipoprotein
MDGDYLVEVGSTSGNATYTLSNFDRCAALSYGRLDLEGGTGSSPVQLMLFHSGVFVGTATDCAFGFTSVDSFSGDSITVTYRWPREGDTNAAPSGQATVTYRWSGESVVMEGELPAELLQVSGCVG